MQKIETKIMNIGELFSNKKYTIGYFQRGYSWQKEHIQDLINDLVNEFRMQKENDDKPANYFLGSIIVSGDNNELSLIDGQQRLTSLSLILIYIARDYPEISEDILPLIFKKEGDEEICTLHVKERTPFMKYLYKVADKSKVPSSNDIMSTSVKNIIIRFNDIESNLLKQKMSPSEIIEFVYWLKNYVCVAQIKTASEKDAYKIFESANDRGVKLSPVDMFKSYILSNVKPDEEKERLDKIWRYRMAEIGNAEESDASAIKCWLRSGHVKTPKDFDEIGKEFHRWIKNKIKNHDIGLEESKDFSQFIEINFEFYTRWYLETNKLAKEFKIGNEAIFCNQIHQYTFQHQIILSSISPSDNNDIILKKIKLVSAFIDIFLAHRLWNSKPITYAKLETYMRNDVIDTIRGKDLNKILYYLKNNLNNLKEEFEHRSLPKADRSRRVFLARFSAWLDEKTGGGTSRLESYIKGKGYDVEHIIPNNYTNYCNIINEHTDEKEFIDKDDFKERRNSFGALLLLKSDFNRSYGQLPYREKLKHYINQDMVLAKTLCENAYERNPRLKQINEQYKIQFESHRDFLKKDIVKREKVYTNLARRIWDPDNLKIIID